MSQWPNFTDAELRCSCCEQRNPNAEFVRLMNRVQTLRNYLGVPLPITSAYRCPNHPIESRKQNPGQHSIAAVDIGCDGELAYEIVEHALKLHFTGIGISQKSGGARFVHLDLRQTPRVWSY